MGFFKKIKSIFSSAPKEDKENIASAPIDVPSADAAPRVAPVVEKATRLVKKKKSFVLTDEMLDQLEVALIQSNFGVKIAKEIKDSLPKISKKVQSAESAEDLLKASLEQCVQKYVRVGDLPDASDEQLKVLVLIGANGAGKTTLTPKLCQHYVQKGVKPLLVVGDTFRAAAQEQSAIWADRVGVCVHQGAYGADPAALAFEGCQRAKAEGCGVVIVDTAGRLHTNKNLMAQLEKIIRVLKKIDPAYPHETILTLDSTTGSHMLAQLAGYKESVNVSGVILTKGDGFSAGGALLAVLQQYAIPILGVSYGESIETFGPFKLKKFLDRIFQHS